MEISPEFAHFVTPEGPPYLFTGGSEEEWFDALESGYFATQYQRRLKESLAFCFMPMLFLIPPGGARPLNLIFNGQVMTARRHAESHDL